MEGELGGIGLRERMEDIKKRGGGMVRRTGREWEGEKNRLVDRDVECENMDRK